MIKFLLLFAIASFSGKIYANTSSKDISYFPNSYEWETRTITEGGFDKVVINQNVIKSKDNKIKISLGKSDFTIAIFDESPQCDKFRGMFKKGNEAIKQNRCKIRIKINDEKIINLPTYDNWWYVQRQIDNRHISGAAFIWNESTLSNFNNLFLKAKKIDVEVSDAKNYYIYEFLKNSNIKNKAINQELISLDKWSDLRDNWTSQPAEVSYMFARCSAAFTALSVYFEINNPKNEKIKSEVEILSLKSNSFILSSVRFGLSTGASENFLTNRAISLTDIYSKMLLENKRIHNTVFMGIIENDLKFCNNYHSLLYKEDGSLR